MHISTERWPKHPKLSKKKKKDVMYRALVYFPIVNLISYDSEIFDDSWNGEPTCKATLKSHHLLLYTNRVYREGEYWHLRSSLTQKVKKLESGSLVWLYKMWDMIWMTHEPSFRVLAFLNDLFWNGVNECQCVECNVSCVIFDHNKSGVTPQCIINNSQHFDWYMM